MTILQDSCAHQLRQADAVSDTSCCSTFYTGDEVTEAASISSGSHTTEGPVPPSVAIYILEEVGSEYGDVYYSMSGTRWH
jgi:hypothetical protein